MKKIRFVLCIALAAVLIGVFACCTYDPYKDYVSTGLEAKEIQFSIDSDSIGDYSQTFEYDYAAIVSTYEEYAAYSFDSEYDEEFFEENELLVIILKYCSSDGMEFGEILEYDGRLYPLFYRNAIEDNQPTTDDIIITPYCVELAKSDNYKLGSIIFCSAERGYLRY